MHRNGFETVSVWQETTPTLPADRKAREQCDVCIIGAGIAGLTAAYLLRREGHDVQVVDAFDMGAGESGRTTAHLTAVLDDRFVTLEKLFGTKGAQLAAASHRAAIDTIERIVREAEIDCDFERVDGVLFTSGPEQVDLLNREDDAALNAGFTDLEAIDALRLPGVRFHGPALRFPRQAQFHVGNICRVWRATSPRAAGTSRSA
jgi:glycine/D-amino acid oxidase-like deaminating enzyme